ncbi:unnamed protein product [Mytilus coruscus]|uniref:PML C-terminal domain-containing protein n=1 Tax=Mytilus coruscus TaxID=42192 RepID=A0A6J8D8S6_MYTCO|nr:unnamed protein product [Mytilus coruscus]
MASSKAPKPRHYGGSCSLKNRLPAAVLQKNEGYSYLPKVNEVSNLSPGDFTTSLTSKMDAKRKKRKQAANKKEIKRRRISLKKKKNLNERKSTVKEGPTYETQFELNMDNTENVPQIPQQIIVSGSESRVFFDLETTGLGRNCEITQIAAKVVRKLKESNLYTTYCKLVKGFVDTLKLARRVINKDEVVNYKQQTLVEKFLNISYSAHNAIEDVKSLQSLFDVKLSSFLIMLMFIPYVSHLCGVLFRIYQEKIITKPASVLLARHGVSFEHIKTVYNRDRKGVKFLFEEYKISQKIVNAINTFLDEE